MATRKKESSRKIKEESPSSLSDLPSQAGTKKENINLEAELIKGNEKENLGGEKRIPNQPVFFKKNNLVFKVGYDVKLTTEHFFAVNYYDYDSNTPTSSSHYLTNKIKSFIGDLDWHMGQEVDFLKSSNNRHNLVTLGEAEAILIIDDRIKENIYDFMFSDKTFRDIVRSAFIRYPDSKKRLKTVSNYYIPLHTSKTFPSTFKKSIKLLAEKSSSFSSQVNITLDVLHDTPFSKIEESFSDWERLINQKIDFHLDDPALEDKLGRKPIAKSLAQLINDDIFGNKKCHAFMTHLQGRWGEGKSSFMKFLENGLQEAGNDRWIVIHYNAWKNQDVDPPWWTFLDAIYKQGRDQISDKSGKRFRWRIRINENIRRLNRGKLLTLSVFAFIIFLILSASNLLGISFLYLPETAKIVVSVSTVLASLWAIGQSWSKFFITNTPENARLFMRRTENPSAHIKQHFEELIKDLQTKHTKGKGNYNIAVFIDDLDRCDGKFVVSLLEGIQTMFNEEKVFYLVAADKHWIAKSFENVYSKYIDTVKKGTKLGYSFIEKNFQLSVRLPNPSKEQISRYWKHILNKKSSDPFFSSNKKEALKEKLKRIDQADILSGKSGLNELVEEFDATLEDAQAAMLETVNETTEDIEHLLMEHHKLLGNNPRAVKRLANQYTVYRNLVLIEQNKVDPLKLFRWVILQNRWPVLVDKLEQDPAHINDYDELLEELDLVSYSIDIEYVMGKDDEKITLDDVVTYTGIGTLDQRK